MKVYNIGIRPIVYDRRKGVKVIQPLKCVDLPEEQAGKVIKKYENAVKKSDFDTFMVKRAETARAATEASKKKIEGPK